MTEVTNEMLAAGLRAWDDCPRGAESRYRLAAAYRAMRALEPVAGPLEHNPAYWAMAREKARGVEVSDNDFESQEGRAHRRLDALTALVLELARLAGGLHPNYATLKRLVAELEDAR